MHAEIFGTYRLQLTPGFGFAEAGDVVAYLKRLGISHLYLSPVLQATPGSEHGYDVVDPTQVSRDLGGEEGLRRLFDRVREAGMGIVLDIVPNHLSTAAENPWWWDVLKNGQGSAHAAAFDIDWQAAGSSLSGKVLLPILDDHLTHVIEAGRIRALPNADGQWELLLEGQRLPVNAAGQEILHRSAANIRETLQLQFYRLCHSQLASEDINYRRFFAIQSLAGLRVEDDGLWATTHRKILELVRSGPIDGIRVDHPDGLRDPAAYFRRLRKELPHQWIVAEKILEDGESLPQWPVDGTTGYDFLQMVGGLWVDPAGEKPISEFYSDFTGHLEPYGVLVRNKKRDIIRSSFKGDLNRIVGLLRAICDKRNLDYPRAILRRLLTEVVASFPVYRTYVQPSRGEVSDADRKFLRSATSAVRGGSSEFEDGILRLLEEILLSTQVTDHLESDFIARFQQLTSPVMAKGVEDTALYCYDRLLTLNEVGCDPTRFGITPEIFHSSNTEAHSSWPGRMLATSTHDNKRSEDVRARLAVISELGEEWANQVREWSSHNSPAWEGKTPDRNTEHLLYQTLVGTWPIEKDRLQAYLMKACREANRFTSWASPNDDYEKRIGTFVDTVLEDRAFIDMLEDFLPVLLAAGRRNSLAQTLLKMTSPGIPDVYQGCEIWDNSLVDPDNRRTVDFNLRNDLLARLEASPDAAASLAEDSVGLSKMHVIRQSLLLRSRRPELFRSGRDGTYRPLLVTGKRLANVLGYSRGEQVAVVVPRLGLRLDDAWGDTEAILGGGRWMNVLDGQTHGSTALVGTLFKQFPVALLEQISK